MNRTKMQTNPITALYCRLSMEDGRDNESMSITNQKAMLKEYAEKNGMLDHAFYVDDGDIIGLNQKTLHLEVLPIKSYFFTLFLPKPYYPNQI